MDSTTRLRAAAFNRHRKRLFGDSSLKVHTTTPEDGETEAAEFTCDWFGQRVIRTTDSTRNDETGAWQFQIIAAEDWKTSQIFMLAVSVLTVETQHWKVKKVEKPIGKSLVWKIKAQIQ